MVGGTNACNLLAHIYSYATTEINGHAYDQVHACMRRPALFTCDVTVAAGTIEIHRRAIRQYVV